MSEPADPEELKELGNQAFAAKNHEQAIAYYTKAIQLDPHNHLYYSNRSAAEAGRLQFDKAAADAKECIKLDPSFVKGYYRLAAAQMELKDYDKAMATIRQGLGIDQGNPQLTKQMRLVQQLKKAAEVQRERQEQVAATAVPNLAKLDEAAAKELQDLQTQYATDNRELNAVQANLTMYQREAKMAELTKEEIEPLPEDCRCYRAVGKIFLQSTKPKVIEHLEAQMSEGRKKEADLTRKMEYLQVQLESHRKNMQEIVSSSQITAE